MSRSGLETPFISHDRSRVLSAATTPHPPWARARNGSEGPPRRCFGHTDACVRAAAGLNGRTRGLPMWVAADVPRRRRGPASGARPGASGAEAAQGVPRACHVCPASLAADPLLGAPARGLRRGGRTRTPCLRLRLRGNDRQWDRNGRRGRKQVRVRARHRNMSGLSTRSGHLFHTFVFSPAAPYARQPTPHRSSTTSPHNLCPGAFY